MTQDYKTGHTTPHFATPSRIGDGIDTWSVGFVPDWEIRGSALGILAALLGAALGLESLESDI